VNGLSRLTYVQSGDSFASSFARILNLENPTRTFDRMTTSTSTISITDAANRVRSNLFREPRELSGRVLGAIEQTLKIFEHDRSAQLVENWYRGAGVADYNSNEAAAAYLGAYGARSILKYQEAVFSLLLLMGQLSKVTTVIDYGSGPCVGFAALLDMWALLLVNSDDEVELNYVAVDRSPNMLAVGDSLCELVQSAYPSVRSTVSTRSPAEIEGLRGDILIVSNVLNEGEGHSEATAVLESVMQTVAGVRSVVIIETASQGSSSQMCNIARDVPGVLHIGPCPSNGNDCREWTFREFRKRIYDFERRCCGTIVGAARDCKYSLALLSFDTEARTLGVGDSVAVRHLGPSGRTLTCRYGDKSWIRSVNARPWDIVANDGAVKETFP
jgi:hypothetical protein